jgi:proteasome lid subunit RPN8/RPN11
MLGLRRRVVDDPLKPLRAHLQIPDALWHEIVDELHTRGAGIRESGAFLLAQRSSALATPPGPPTVVAAAYYDDLDAACLTGGITMSGTAYDRLWERCRNEGLRVVADIHTHPGEWVSQSHIDRANPMMALAGHLALIIGNFADPSCRPLPLGLHRYLGNAEWETLSINGPAAHPLRPGRPTRWWRRLRLPRRGR